MSDAGATRGHGDGTDAANLARSLLESMPSDAAVALLQSTLKRLLPPSVEADFVHPPGPPPSPPPGPPGDGGGSLRSSPQIAPNAIAKKVAKNAKKRPGSAGVDKSEPAADEAEGQAEKLAGWDAEKGGGVRGEPSLDAPSVSGPTPEWAGAEGAGALGSPHTPAASTPAASTPAESPGFNQDRIPTRQDSKGITRQDSKGLTRQDSKGISFAPGAEPAASPITPSGIGLASAGKMTTASNKIAQSPRGFFRQDTAALQRALVHRDSVRSWDMPSKGGEEEEEDDDDEEEDEEGEEGEPQTPSMKRREFGPYMLGATQSGMMGSGGGHGAVGTAVDTTGDGKANAIGFDTTGDGQIDSVMEMAEDAEEVQKKLEKKQQKRERQKRRQEDKRELERVKAMTMYDMIEEIQPAGNRWKKLLFLTGDQAEMITQNPLSLELLLEKFDVGTPQLVINLLESGGFGDWTRQRPAESWRQLNLRWAPGVFHGVAPFATIAEERAAEYRVDLFMADILIPLAAQTHAVIICCAIPTQCVLSSSFTRMFQAVKAKWLNKPPFTVLSTTNDMIALYASGRHHPITHELLPPEERYKGTEWYKVMTKSVAWFEGHKDLEERLRRADALSHPVQFDLDPNAMCYLIVDDGGQGQFSTLINALTRHLATSLPSLAIKTGSSRKRPLGFKDPSTLEVAADSANSGTPTLFLDVRPIPRSVYKNARSREGLIRKAKEFFDLRNLELRKARGGIVDTFDVCALACFHDILTGDGDPTTEEIRIGGRNNDEPTPLHKAIRSNIKQRRQKSQSTPGGEVAPTVDMMDPNAPGAQEWVINEAEKLTGLDLDGDGDVGVWNANDDAWKMEAVKDEEAGPSRKSALESLTENIPDILGGNVISQIVGGAESNRRVADDSDWKNEPAMPQQIVAASDWLTDYFFRNAYEMLPESQKRQCDDFENHGRVLYKEPMLAMSVACRTLLSSTNFYHINLTHHATAKRLVQQLVQLDRLPKENSLEGLLLLRSAWRDFDVAMLLADRYKRVCKVSFILQLLLGWSAVTLSAVASETAGLVAPSGNRTVAVTVTVAMAEEAEAARRLSEGEIDAALAVGLWFKGTLVHLIFALSVTMTFIIAFDSILNSHGRWKQLRIGAGALESIIWKYRTRTGAFEIDDEHRGHSGVRLPESILLQAIKQTRTNMLASANLTSSEFTKRYSAGVYKHFQDRGTPTAARGPLPADAEARHTEDIPIDDHQSPTQPTKYIALRIEPAITFYQKRIPQYARRATAMKLIVVLLGIGASALARYEEVFLVILVTSAAAAATSWSEFADTQRKTERYTRSVQGLRDLLDWWRSLNEVEKASKTVISHLVNGTESIINAEQTAWTSTPASDKDEDGRTDKHDDSSDGETFGR